MPIGSFLQFKLTILFYRTNAFAIPPSTFIIFPVDLSKIPTKENTPFAISSGVIISFNKFLFA